MDYLTEVKKRFRSYVEVDSNGCWIWLGTLCRGYALLKVNGTSVRAARWIYSLLIGPIPEGHELHHTCLVKECVNPAHLEPMTHKEHAQIHAKLGSWNGERNGFAKRTTEEVLTIKLLNQYFMLPATLISRAMSIPQRSVYSITRGEVWNHLQLPEKSQIEKEMMEEI